MESTNNNKSIKKKVISKYDLDFHPVFRDLRELEVYFEGFRSTINNIDVELNYVHTLKSFPDLADKICYSGEHKQNLSRLECTCSNFEKNKDIFDPNDIRRLCKHLYWKLSNLQLVDKLSLLLTFDSVYFNYRKMFKISYGMNFVIVSYRERNSWINIYTKEKEWERYAYDLNQKRWSYNNKPSNHKRLESDVNSIFNKVLFVKGLNC